MAFIFTAVKLLWFMLVAHLLCDYKLQGTTLSAAKNHKKDNGGYRPVPWQLAMFAHGLMHGAAVLLITGSVVLGIFEGLSHAAIDYSKNSGWISFKTDQMLHASLKAVYSVIIAIKIHFGGF